MKRNYFFIFFVVAWLGKPVLAEDFVIKEAASRLAQETFVVDADIQYHLTDVVLEALENGVPLTVDVHIQVRRVGAWIWEGDVADFHFRRQLRYQPLASIYQVVDVGEQRKGKKRRFVSRSAAIDALGEIVGIPVIHVNQLKKGEEYFMEIRAELDIEALPVPLRPSAYISSNWKLSSEWKQWRIRP